MEAATFLSQVINARSALGCVYVSCALHTQEESPISACFSSLNVPFIFLGQHARMNGEVFYMPQEAKSPQPFQSRELI